MPERAAIAVVVVDLQDLADDPRVRWGGYQASGQLIASSRPVVAIAAIMRSASARVAANGFSMII